MNDFKKGRRLIVLFLYVNNRKEVRMTMSYNFLFLLKFKKYVFNFDLQNCNYIFSMLRL